MAKLIPFASTGSPQINVPLGRRLVVETLCVQVDVTPPGSKLETFVTYTLCRAEHHALRAGDVSLHGAWGRIRLLHRHGVGPVVPGSRDIDDGLDTQPDGLRRNPVSHRVWSADLN